ncbi:MAG: methyltransferase domain-containing protein [Hyphomicrobiales bacterium]|nr:methyltransferase domain-containing protein [Hyphomicrobiales bacterium]MDE2017822.1 methyltransferase domain-containing protein [Hyphomicrobiales bacterium]
MTNGTPTGPPALFDRALRRARLARAAASGAAVDFLLARAADDLADRLALVSRRFARALDLGTPGPHVADALRAGGRVEAIERIASFDAPPADAGADLVVSALALQDADDLPGALALARRALKPDGLMLACLVGGESLKELRHALAAAEAELRGGASPRVHPFADLRDLGALMQRAGFALPVVDLERIVVRYPDLAALMRDLRGMGATNSLLARSRKPVGRAFFARAQTVYAEAFADADGRLPATLDLIWLSGWAPDPSQPKPLKPGAATMRLEDALKPPGEPA